MMHTKRCPYCKNIVGGGHGDPIKHLGSPLKQCTQCQNTYIDSDMIEWVVSPFYRKIGYCFANNRIWLCLLPSVIFAGMAESFWAFLVSFTIIFVFCCFYVMSQVKEQIESSKSRAEDKDYIAILIAGGYPVKEDFYS